MTTHTAHHISDARPGDRGPARADMAHRVDTMPTVSGIDQRDGFALITFTDGTGQAFRTDRHAQSVVFRTTKEQQ